MDLLLCTLFSKETIKCFLFLTIVDNADINMLLDTKLSWLMIPSLTVLTSVVVLLFGLFIKCVVEAPMVMFSALPCLPFASLLGSSKYLKNLSLVKILRIPPQLLNILGKREGGKSFSANKSQGKKNNKKTTLLPT